MKRYIASLLVIMTCTLQMCWSAQKNSTITWLTNYQEAVNLSKTSSKPLVLFFTGSDWCTYCNKLEEEVFSKKEFADAAGDKFIFLKLDFPESFSLDPKTTTQNKQLQKQYDVRSYPTVIVLDPKLRQIGILGYLTGGPRQYAAKLLRMIGDYHAYQQKVQSLNETILSGVELKQLFEKARELYLEDDLALILKKGLNSDQKLFFQTERYRQLADEGFVHSPEAVALKQQLLATDPRNERKIHYEIAVIEFEAYSEEMDKENYAPELAVAPLASYIEKFGQTDKENLWRIQMLIAQVYLDKNKLAQALKFAQSSYESAPPTVQQDIATAIKNIRAQTQ